MFKIFAVIGIVISPMLYLWAICKMKNTLLDIGKIKDDFFGKTFHYISYEYRYAMKSNKSISNKIYYVKIFSEISFIISLIFAMLL